ncbi:MAG: hypothetical protein ACRC6V_06905 [Bacteroidales bacterium]
MNPKVIISEIEKLAPKSIMITATKPVFGGDILFINIDALKKEDHPNGIAQNSIYLTFVVRLDEGFRIIGQTWLRAYGILNLRLIFARFTNAMTIAIPMVNAISTI